MTPQKIVLFIDADKDDLYSLCLIAAQQYYGIIDVIGIVVETGFVSIQDGLLFTQQFLNKIQVATNIDNCNYGFPIKFNLYAGFPRPEYLDRRLFPKIWVNSFVNRMKEIYNITIPNYDYITNEFIDIPVNTNAPNVDILFSEIMNLENLNRIKILATGPPTSLAIGLDKYPIISSKIKSIYCMASNYLTKGNVPEQDSLYAGLTLHTPYLDFNGEYNAFLNPYALQRVILSVGNNIDINIIPLDCTNYAPLTTDTINEIKVIAQPYLYFNKNPWTINLYNYFVSLVETTIITINSTLYLWDLCAANIALGSDVEQFYILGSPIISVSGKINLNTFNSNDRVKIYMSLKYIKLLINSIRIIFNDSDYKT